MKSRVIHVATVGLSAALFAFSAAGQMGSTSNPAGQDKTAMAMPAKAGTVAATGGSHQHANAQHRSHASHKQMASSANSEDSVYRAALKTCVQGPSTQKDRCIDDTIMRFGRG